MFRIKSKGFLIQNYGNVNFDSLFQKKFSGSLKINSRLLTVHNFLYLLS